MLLLGARCPKFAGHHTLMPGLHVRYAMVGMGVPMTSAPGIPTGEVELLIVRRGDKVVCTQCGQCNKCVGTIGSFNDWYGQTVVTVYFDNPKWDHCDREVFYLSDLQPNPLTKQPEVQAETIGYQ